MKYQRILQSKLTVREVVVGVVLTAALAGVIYIETFTFTGSTITTDAIKTALFAIAIFYGATRHFLSNNLSETRVAVVIFVLAVIITIGIEFFLNSTEFGNQFLLHSIGLIFGFSVRGIADVVAEIFTGKHMMSKS